jgi:enamine deaminase RidA (YjgF/YER057c/UK114 family)
MLTHLRRPATILSPLLRRNMSVYKVVSTSSAPSAIGPYSQAVVHNGLAYSSGSIGFEPSTMQIVDGGVEAQTRQALKNLKAVVEAAGASTASVLKTTVFLKVSDAVQSPTPSLRREAAELAARSRATA